MMLKAVVSYYYFYSTLLKLVKTPYVICFRKLRTLELDDLVQVDNIKKCIKEVQGALPECKISYTMSK